MAWYSFTPIDSFPHNTGDPNNYTLVGSTPPNCPNPNNFLCAIEAKDNGGKPTFTINLFAEIATALDNKIETTNVRLRPTLI